MASFMEELWNGVFTPGPTPALLLATNVSLAALQLVLFALLAATYSIHFFVLSLLCGTLWFLINWFVREFQAEKAKQEASKERSREKSLDPDSETETEAAPPSKKSSVLALKTQQSTSLRPVEPGPDEVMRRRRSLGDSSGYQSTDSEWEKISEGEEKAR